jgi:chorismate-pyruvate lyase
MAATPRISLEAARDAQLDTARALVERHFIRQAELPDSLHEIDIGALDSALRTLLFTDGTVTRTLEVQTLSHVSVDVVDQHTCAAPDRVARYLDLNGGHDAVQRRVAMRIGDCRPAVWAESHIIPSRLPEDFLTVLRDSPEGIGESLQRLMLESARELLWFGLGEPPEWAETRSQHALCRLYRVTSHGETALLIAEWFAVEFGSGAYRLAWLTDAAPAP